MYLYQVLLLTRGKLENCKRVNQKYSNWGRIIKHKNVLKLPLRVITWENLFDICLDKKVDSLKK